MHTSQLELSKFYIGWQSTETGSKSPTFLVSTPHHNLLIFKYPLGRCHLAGYISKMQTNDHQASPMPIFITYTPHLINNSIFLFPSKQNVYNNKSKQKRNIIWQYYPHTIWSCTSMSLSHLTLVNLQTCPKQRVVREICKQWHISIPPHHFKNFSNQAK